MKTFDLAHIIGAAHQDSRRSLPIGTATGWQEVIAAFSSSPSPRNGIAS
jgi:hypothetical protein